MGYPLEIAARYVSVSIVKDVVSSSIAHEPANQEQDHVLIFG